MATDLIFDGLYRPPTCHLVELNFNPIPAGYAQASAELTTDLITITATALVVNIANADLFLSDTSITAIALVVNTANADLFLNDSSITATALVACTADADLFLSDVTITATATTFANVYADFILSDVTITATASTFFQADADLFLSDTSITAITVVVYVADAGLFLSDTDIVANVAFVYVATTDFILDDAILAGLSSWESGVFRGLETTKISTEQSGQNFYRQLSGHFLHGNHQPIKFTSLFNAGNLYYLDKCFNWFEVLHKTKPAALAWEPGQSLTQKRSNVYSASPRKYLYPEVTYEAAGTIHAQRISGYIAPSAKPETWIFDYDVGVTRIQVWLSGYGLGTDINRVERSLWDQATTHSWLWGGWHYPPPPPPPPFIPSVDLRYYQPEPQFIGGAILEFGHPCFAWPLTNPNLIILEGSTIVLHEVTVKRTADNVEVPVLSVSLKFDVDSWAWGVTLNLKAHENIALLASVNGEPCEIQINLDGIYFTVLIEEWGETWVFGEINYSATGRSAMALFAYPYAPLRSYLEAEDKTAAQLIDFELLNTGWEVIYHASLLQLFTTDWLVPGGAWSYQNKAPVDCIVQIARAVGARAYADRNAKLIHVDPRYPVNPWDWADAAIDKTIPINLVRSLSTQLSPQPDYNHIIVSGQSHGVTVSASIEGSGGDVPAPMIIDNLITYVQAGRERSRNVLCNTGKQARVTLDLPLNSTTGLLEPGQLIEVSDTIPWRGLVTGITIAASHGLISQYAEIQRVF